MHPNAFMMFHLISLCFSTGAVEQLTFELLSRDMEAS
jgi:hypothetical protein